jgi:hypothetical protein
VRVWRRSFPTSERAAVLQKNAGIYHILRIGVPEGTARGRKSLHLASVAVTFGDRAMAVAWTVRDNAGQILAGFDCASRLEVARKVAPTHYDPFRLQVSHSYREVFDRVVNQVLERKGWKIVRMKVRKTDLASSMPSA